MAISWIDALISSTAVATVSTLRDTCSPAADTAPDWAEVSSALEPISVDTAISSCEAEASVSEFWAICPSAPRRFSAAVLKAVAIRPVSSTVSTSSVLVRSLWAIASRLSTLSPSGFEMPLAITNPSAIAIRRRRA